MSCGPAQSLQEGYEKFVIKNSNGCWDWKGCCPINPGYGQFRSKGKMYKAHRASWILTNGEIPKGLSVLHKCDNKRCSNPAHLFLGTQRDNMLDAIKKKRTITIGRKDKESPLTKIFKTNYWKILRLKELGFSKAMIADIFNVCRATIRKVINKSQGVVY